MMSKFKIGIYCTLALLTICVQIQADENAKKDQMINDLNKIKSTFSVKYAPTDWKKSYANWDLTSQIETAKVKLEEKENITVKDFQRILKDFFNSTKDYHVGVQFYSTEVAVLPFRIHSAQGKYYIAWVYPKALPNNVKIDRGDEVVMFQDKPIAEAVAELQAQEMGNPDSKTDHALAESFLTMRMGTKGDLVPQGPVKISIRHRNSNKTTTYELEWMYASEEIGDTIKYSKGAYAATASKKPMNLASKLMVKKTLNQDPFFNKDMIAPVYRHIKSGEAKIAKLMAARNDNDDEDIVPSDTFVGDEKSFLPLLGRIIWQAKDETGFYAYMYKTEQNKTIGYIRIPHYVGGESNAKSFGEIIQDFQSKTDALVIDQLNNPGGNLFYMYGLAAMLSDKPLVLPLESVTITQEDVYFAVSNLEELEEIDNDEQAKSEIGESLYGLQVDKQLAKEIASYFRFIINEWNEGRTFTNNSAFFGISDLKPNTQVHYTKPIVFLVNNLDFSCGDFMPAILQDNKRAVIMGSRTAGAGGYVLSHSFPNLFGLAGYSFTGSIAERADHKPIENLGVTPDVPYELTSKDIEQNYVPYIRAINAEVNKLIKK